MYEKEINELKKKIEYNKQKIERVEDDNKFKKRIITILIVLSIVLGVGLASVVSHPLAAFILCAVPGTLAGFEIYDKGIMQNQRTIETCQRNIKKSQDDIKLYEADAQNHSKEYEISNAENKNQYAYSSDLKKSQDEFMKYIDELKDDGFFQDMDSNNKKR